MFFLYLYGAMGLLTAAAVGAIAFFAMVLPGTDLTWRDYAGAVGAMLLGFVAWPVYVAGLAYSIWRDR